MKPFEQYPVFVFNTLKRQKEQFKSIHEGRVGMYVCGPTVYGDPHLGHARSAITFDIVFRYLKFLGYKVRYVRNITDVGHLEDEIGGTGEDKVAKKARIDQVEPMEIVQHYTKLYHDAMNRLNVLPPSIEPSATGHIIEQIDIINKIINNGFAYEINGSVYFDMDKYNQTHNYGELSGKVLEDLISGSRDLDGQSEKRNPHDFALWKSAKPEHIMRWPSPWGEGFPGWHVECTAMSAKYLGLPFDIHGGGMDLQFPHHEGEIAQSFGACGCAPVNYWLHNNMVTLDGQKMAKSKGNFITLDEFFTGTHKLLEKAYEPMTVRFFILQSHYGSTIDFSNEALLAAEKAYKRLSAAYKALNELVHTGNKAINEEVSKELSDLCNSCYEYMSDDFNTAKTVASLFEMSKRINDFRNKALDVDTISTELFDRVKTTYIAFFTQVLGLSPYESGSSEVLDATLQLLIRLRNEAKEQKNYALADQIRNELKTSGIQLKDEKGGGTTYAID